MAAGHRHTIITQGRLAMRTLRLEAAREGRHGVQILSIEQVAARLAGGFVQPLDDDVLLSVIQSVLPRIELGELDAIKRLPGMAGAAADTLRRVWRAGMDLQGRSGQHPRLASLARLEAAVLAALPPATLAPAALLQAALQRMALAPALLGTVDCRGMADLPPCWRPLLAALARHVRVRWIAGPRPVPAWLTLPEDAVLTEPAAAPCVLTCNAATAQHEAIEAMRWARQLLASGRARPEEIGIAAVSPADYDDHFLALREQADFDLHMVHGVPVLASADGQAAAALADVLARGLSQSGMRRLARLCAGGTGLLGGLPSDWTQRLPADAPMRSAAAWRQWLSRQSSANWPQGGDVLAALSQAVELLAAGVQAAQAAGEALLDGRARAIWRRALLAGPPAAIDVTLGSLKQDDGLDPCVAVAWMPASSLAAAPRRFVRLLGMNSSRWPRTAAEDRLLSDHIVPAEELDPMPTAQVDRRDFQIILATTAEQVVLSRARRDAEGRLLGRSPLLAAGGEDRWLRRNGMVEHAFSESDRLLARPGEFGESLLARSALQCWHHWHRDSLTPHDGLVRADHPAIAAALQRTQSASSLSRLLRNPAGFVWQYVLGWRAPRKGSEPIVLDALSLGNLVHLVLERTVWALERDGGLGAASPAAIDAAVADATALAAAQWEAEAPVPPAAIWRRTLDDVRALASRALRHRDPALGAGSAWAEVPFGGAQPGASDRSWPWDIEAPVEIPGTGIRIRGYIDRLDLAQHRPLAAVTDYKTGRTPAQPIRLNQGKELQRCLYAFAVRSLLDREVEIRAALLYPRDGTLLLLEEPEQTLDELGGYLRAAVRNLLQGNLLPGIAAGDDYDDLRFALPANARAAYLPRKRAAIEQRLGDAVQVWTAE